MHYTNWLTDTSRYVKSTEIHNTFDIDGYFHTMIWFWEYPCVLTSSFTFLHQARLQTYNPRKMVRTAVE
jgi:hypothetical protein